MKNQYIFLAIILFGITVNAQTIADNTTFEDTIFNKTENADSENQHDEDYPWHARRFKVTAGAFFPVNNTQVQV